jgi:hypothetical protein
MTLTNWSGSCYFFAIDIQDSNKKLILKKVFCFLLFEGTFTVHHFSKIKRSKRSHKAIVIKVFLTIFAWWCGSGSKPLTNGLGSGSRRPKNIRIDGSGFGSGSAGAEEVHFFSNSEHFFCRGSAFLSTLARPAARLATRAGSSTAWSMASSPTARCPPTRQVPGAVFPPFIIKWA